MCVGEKSLVPLGLCKDVDSTSASGPDCGRRLRTQSRSGGFDYRAVEPDLYSLPGFHGSTYRSGSDAKNRQQQQSKQFNCTAASTATTEFGRKLESFQSFESRLFELLESARPADAQPDSDDTPGSLVALRNNPEARAVFRSFRMNTEARMWYLNQMLTATMDLLGHLQTDVLEGS